MPDFMNIYVTKAIWFVDTVDFICEYRFDHAVSWKAFWGIGPRKNNMRLLMTKFHIFLKDKAFYTWLQGLKKATPQKKK